MKVWTDVGESDWSRACVVRDRSARSRGDWSAQWIGPDEPSAPPAGERPAHVLRTTFTLDASPRDAGLYATAHGVYETFLNGQPGRRPRADARASPPTGPTSTSRPTTSPTSSSPARTSWRVVLSDGWYRGRTGFGQTPTATATTVAFLGQLARRRRRRRHRCGAGRRPPDPSSPPTSWPARREDRRVAARGVAPGHRRRPRRRVAHRLARATGAPRRGAAARSRPPARRRTPGRRPRPEHQRLGPAQRPRPGRHRARRWCTAKRSTPTATSRMEHLAAATTPTASTAGRPGRSRGRRRVARATGSNRATRPTASSTCGSRDTRTGSPPTT